ncbi:hypothetical protein BK748_27370 [Bacillus thuringiensis serovar graciosensis]|nr:hypothetical protein BK748_27370 [Bacillus thuringiensis serovar graciosensis]
MEQIYNFDCLFLVILKNMKLQIIFNNTRVLKIGMCGGYYVSVHLKGWNGLYESDPNVLYVYRI